MTETVRYRNKGPRPGTGMLQHRTEIPDAEMPIPAASPAKLTDGLQRFRTDSFCLPSKLRTRHMRFMIVVFLLINFFLSQSRYFLEVITSSVR
jgi:hypothetical protein